MRKPKGLLKRVAEYVFELEADLASRWASGAHWRLKAAQWGLSPRPDYFDHHIDLFHQWLKTRNPMWMERGAFSLFALKGGTLLELACGDGFNTRNFYSLKSQRVIACDLDSNAIATARSKNSAPNVDFVVADIRSQMPPGDFDNIVWDFGFPLVRYFKPQEIEHILAEIKRRLAARKGILSGCTEAELIAAEAGEYSFRTIEDVRAFLAPHFERVVVFETTYPARHNFYFWASDGNIPFQGNGRSND